MTNPMGFSWSRIQGTQLASEARGHIELNELAGCTYHNLEHVESMYQYLADANEPYDEALDWAVLFHDIVYDEKPEKELGSAKKFMDLIDCYEGCTLNIDEKWFVFDLIMATADHICENGPNREYLSRMIRADLHGLTNQLTAFQNFGKIMSESMKLYNIDTVTFAENSEKFMDELFFRVKKNIHTDPDHQDFYVKACEGILYTIELAQFIQGKHK